MNFLNPPVEVELLPAMEQVEMKPVSYNYLKVLRLELAITSAVLLLIIFTCIYFIPVLRQSKWMMLLSAAWIVFTVMRFIIQQQSFKFSAYAIREKDILYRSGWIIRKIRTCPFNRIQHSSISSGPLERRYKLATLILYTAGTDDSDVRVPGLPEEEATALKEWINKKVVDES